MYVDQHYATFSWTSHKINFSLRQKITMAIESFITTVEFTQTTGNDLLKSECESRFFLRKKNSSQFLLCQYAHSPTFPSLHLLYVTTHSPTLPSLYLRHSSFSNPSGSSPTSQFILQPFFRFSYVTSSSLNTWRAAHGKNHYGGEHT